MLIEPWSVEMLGRLRARLRDRAIERFRTRQVAALFAYLAYHSDGPRIILARLCSLRPGSIETALRPFRLSRWNTEPPRNDCL